MLISFITSSLTIMFHLTRIFAFTLVVLQVTCANTIARHDHSPGCGNIHNFAGLTKNFTIKSGGRSRNYSLHLPSDYKHFKPASLILAYHGAGDDPAKMERVTRFSDKSVNRDMIVAYPLGDNVRV